MQGKRVVLKLTIGILIIVSLGIDVIATNGKKEIIYFTGCTNNEIKADIEKSINGLTSFANKYHISLKEKHTNRCGYLLIYENKKKIIDSALTDVDLLTICSDFFEIQ